MSLELAIQQNTAAINQLIEILSKGITAAPAAPPEPPGLTLEETFAETPAPKPKKKAEPAPAPVSYADAAGAVTRLVKEKGRDAAKALLSSFGAANLKEIPEAKFAEVLAAAEKALA